MRRTLLFSIILFVATLAALPAESRAQSTTPKPPKTAENRILVSGAVTFAYTRKSASCDLKNGKLVSFQDPSDGLEPAFPVTTGMLENGRSWYVQMHPPSASRDFEDDNVGGVVLVPLPGGNWSVKLQNVKLPEQDTMSINYAYVSGTITCTSYTDLSHIGQR